MFRLAHISDMHLAATVRPRGRELLNKRLIGYLNWHRGRRAIHQRPALDALIADLHKQHPDHIAVTGDLVNFGLPAEFEEALDWLRALGPPERVSVVPGNHDAYVSVPYAAGMGHWRAFMHGDARGIDFHADHIGFPYVRLAGPAALIGLCSAVPTLPFMAAGRLGSAQLHALRHILDQLRGTGRFRIVLIHHPPLPGQTSWARALRDAKPLRALLRRHGAELVLHGHNHRQEVHTLQHDHGQTAVVGVPSASIATVAGRVLARYNLYTVSGAPGAWRCEMIGRGLLDPGGGVHELERIILMA